jgi:hypothetical protein
MIEAAGHLQSLRCTSISTLSPRLGRGKPLLWERWGRVEVTWSSFVVTQLVKIELQDMRRCGQEWWSRYCKLSSMHPMNAAEGIAEKLQVAIA